MKGNNTLRLNEATMIEAVQYWLQKEMTTAPKVVSVKESKGVSSYATTFDVEVTDPDSQEPA